MYSNRIQWISNMFSFSKHSWIHRMNALSRYKGVLCKKVDNYLIKTGVLIISSFILIRLGTKVSSILRSFEIIRISALLSKAQTLQSLCKHESIQYSQLIRQKQNLKIKPKVVLDHIWIQSRQSKPKHVNFLRLKQK